MKEEEKREKRKRRLKKQNYIDKIKMFFGWIVTGIFWFVVTVTFIKGFFGTFFHSANEPQDDYEEYIHSIIP